MSKTTLDNIQRQTVEQIVRFALESANDGSFRPHFAAFGWACIHNKCMDAKSEKVRLVAAERLRQRHKWRDLADTMATQHPGKLVAGFADILYDNDKMKRRAEQKQRGYNGWSQEERLDMQIERKRQMRMLAVLLNHGFNARFDPYRGCIIVAKQARWLCARRDDLPLASVNYEFRTGQVYLSTCPQAFEGEREINELINALLKLKCVIQEANAAGA